MGVDSYTKWVAKYGVNNGQPGNKPNVSNFDIWQYTSKGSCDGIGSSGLDMNICYRDFPAELGESKPAPAQPKKSNEKIAKDDRKNRLSAAGYDYNAIQAIVNQKAAPAPAKKSNEEIAKEVLAGKWGNNPQRKAKLEAAGYNYATIQALVNKMC